MILHLLLDEKFNDYVINQFEDAAPSNNHFVLILPNEDYKCKYVNNNEKLDFIIRKSHQYSEFVANLKKYKAIVIHGFFTEEQEEIVRHSPTNVKIAWVFWGAELYVRKNVALKTLGLYSKLVFFIFKIKTGVKASLYMIKNFEIYKTYYEPSIKSFLNIDFCLTDIEEDYQKAKKYFNNDFKWLWYNYYSIEETLGNLQTERINGDNILIGNSATVSNNHLEVFSKIAKYDFSGRKIIVPLGYGDNNYKRLLMSFGKYVFKEKFFPLVDFYEKEQYNNFLTSCSVAIFNNIRHQAMGNIITTIWLGTRVYLSDQSTTFSYLKELGIFVFSFEKDFNSSNQNFINKLSDDMVEHNRRILMAVYGNKIMKVKLKNLIDRIST